MKSGPRAARQMPQAASEGVTAKMLDDNDLIIFPPATDAIEEAVEVSLDDLDAPETIEIEPDDEDWAVEFDDSLVDDSDDFHEEE